jgi:hypothetical protein
LALNAVLPSLLDPHHSRSIDGFGRDLGRHWHSAQPFAIMRADQMTTESR